MIQMIQRNLHDQIHIMIEYCLVCIYYFKRTD